MVKKIDADIRTNNGYKSYLNINYLVPENEDEAMDAVFGDSEGDYCYKKIVESDKQGVKDFLERQGLPSDFDKSYEMEVKDKGERIFVDGVLAKDARLKPTDIFVNHFNGNFVGKGNIIAVLQDYFSHIAGVREAANAIFYFRQLDKAVGNNDLDRSLFCSMCIGSYMRRIMLSEVEDYIHSETAKRKNTVNTEQYILQRWNELSAEKVSLNSASSIIFKELSSLEDYRALTESTIRKKLQGKNLQSMKDRYEQSR